MEMDPNRPLGEDSEPLLSNSNSTAQPDTEQVPTITESKTQPRHGGKLPRSYIEHWCEYALQTFQANILVYHVATSSVTVITSQPRFHSLKQCSSEVAKAGEHLYILSMFLAVLCAICGTPLTLVCFIPAMFLSRKVLYTYM